MLNDADIRLIRAKLDKLHNNILFCANKRVSQSGLEAITEAQKIVAELKEMVSNKKGEVYEG